MKVTKVTIQEKVVKAGGLRAFVSVTLDGGLVLNELRLIHSAAGWRIVYPLSPFCRNGKQYLYLPINNETRKMIEEAVLAEYRKEMET